MPMKKLSISFLFPLFFATAMAQVKPEIVTKTTALIAEGKYSEATQYVDAALQLDPKNVDALMMKGNVLLNYTLSKTEPLFFISSGDESIYSPDLKELQDPPRILKREEALRIEQLWRKCLQLAPKRSDSRMGLCVVYALALMKKELLLELPKVYAARTDTTNEFSYILANYAQQLKVRGDYKGCLDVFDKIILLYPKFGGIVSDKAAECYLHGDFEMAQSLIAQALQLPNPDATTISNAIDIYTATGETDKALLVFYKAAESPQFFEYGFYKGLYQYSIGQEVWRNEIKTYWQSMAGKQDTVAQKIANYMMDKSFQNTYSNFLMLLSFNPNEYAVQLICQGAMRAFPDSLMPALVYAESFLNSKNFKRANEEFKKLEKRKMQEALHADFDLQYAYSLYQANDFKNSITQWQPLLQTESAFVSEVAAYFIARSSEQLGEREVAKKKYEELVSRKSGSKYEYLASKILTVNFSEQKK